MKIYIVQVDTYLLNKYLVQMKFSYISVLFVFIRDLWVNEFLLFAGEPVMMVSDRLVPLGR